MNHVRIDFMLTYGMSERYGLTPAIRPTITDRYQTTICNNPLGRCYNVYRRIYINGWQLLNLVHIRILYICNNNNNNNSLFRIKYICGILQFHIQGT